MYNPPKTKPSHRLKCLPLYIKNSSSMLIINNIGNPMNNTLFVTTNGVIKADKPITKKTFNIFDPKILPINTLNSFFRSADIDTDSSGSDVPIATTVNPIIEVSEINGTRSTKNTDNLTVLSANT